MTSWAYGKIITMVGLIIKFDKIKSGILVNDIIYTVHDIIKLLTEEIQT